MKKFICILLALITAAFPLTSCGNDTLAETTGTDTQSAQAPESETETETEAETEPDILEGISYDGADFHIMTSATDLSSNYLLQGSEELNGELVNDAVFNRNLAAEQKLKIHLTYTQTNRTDCFSVASEIKRLIMSGDDSYDLIVEDQLGMSTSSIDGLFVDAAALPTVDFTQSGWSHDYMYNLSIDYKSVYLLVGDYFMDVLNNSHILPYNRKVYEDLYGDPDDLYKTVLEGAWTMDLWNTMIEDAYIDTNGNGTTDKEDMLGMITGGIGGSTFPMIFGTDTSFVERDESGYPTITMYNERMLLLFDKIYNIYYNQGTDTTFTYNGSDMHQKFMGDETLFICNIMLGGFGVFRDMKSDIGVVPYPKLDESQEHYITVVHDTAELGAIPITAKNPEMSGAVTHQLCRLTHTDVLPQYYETALKIKYARDEHTATIIDMIRDGISDMFCLAYQTQYANNIFTWALLEPLQNGTHDVTSAYEKREKAAIEGLERLVKDFEKNKNQ